MGASPIPRVIPRDVEAEPDVLGFGGQIADDPVVVAVRVEVTGRAAGDCGVGEDDAIEGGAQRGKFVTEDVGAVITILNDDLGSGLSVRFELRKKANIALRPHPTNQVRH